MDKIENGKEEKRVVVLQTAQRVYIAYLEGTSNTSVIVSQPLFFGEHFTPENNSVQIMFRKVVTFLPVPKRAVIVPEYSQELNPNAKGEAQLISAYEKQLSLFAAEDCGIVAPTMDDISKLVLR